MYIYFPDPADLISFLEEAATGFREPSLVYVFFYNVYVGYECYLDETVPDNDCCSLETGINDTYYVIGKRLWNYSRRKIDVPRCDFGITIVMMWFSHYYRTGEYPIFIMNFRSVNELEHLETFLVTYRASSLKLPTNLATHETYGIKANLERFNRCEIMTMVEFNVIVAIMRVSRITPEEFINTVKKYPIPIISSVYMFTSITKEMKLIKECRELYTHKYNYRVQIVKTPSYTGDYWFYVPPKAIWFGYIAYGQRSWTYQSYVSRDVDCSMFKFRHLKTGVLVGFVTNNITVPVIVRSQELINNWDNMINYLFPALNITSILSSTPPPQNVPNVYFIRNQDPTIYRLVNEKASKLK